MNNTDLKSQGELQNDDLFYDENYIFFTEKYINIDVRCMK